MLLYGSLMISTFAQDDEMARVKSGMTTAMRGKPGFEDIGTKKQAYDDEMEARKNADAASVNSEMTTTTSGMTTTMRGKSRSSEDEASHDSHVCGCLPTPDLKSTGSNAHISKRRAVWLLFFCFCKANDNIICQPRLVSSRRVLSLWSNVLDRKKTHAVRSRSVLNSRRGGFMTITFGPRVEFT